MQREGLEEFGAVVERYQSLVWAIAYSITSDPSLSEDVTQETFLALWNQQADIQDLSKLKGYLATIARNLGRRALRGMGHNVVDGDGIGEAKEPIEARGPLDEAIKREEFMQVNVALEQMPISSREAFVLFYAEGQSVAGVADQLELSQSAVKQRLFRARESLKDSVATGLSQAITAGVPGKAFASATMTFILAKSEVASAAALSASSVPSPATFATPQGIRTGMLKVGSAVIVAGAAAALLTAQASTSADNNTKSLVATSPLPNLAASSQESSTPRSWPSPNLPFKPTKTQIPDVTQGARLQGFAGRLYQKAPSADLDGDGQLSEDEVYALRDSQEDELTKQIMAHWQDSRCTCGAVPAHGPYGITCAFIAPTDDGQPQEGWIPYDLSGLRARYEEELNSGIAMDTKQWLSSRIATAQEEHLCYEVTATLHDKVQALRADAKETALTWVASVTFRHKEALFFPPPKELEHELVSITSEGEAKGVANRWGVQLLVETSNVEAESNAPRYVAVTSKLSEAAEWNQLPRAIQAAIEARPRH